MRFARKSNGTGDEFSSEGHRVLGVAYREMPTRTAVTRDDESEMIFAGFVVLSDPPKAGIGATINELKQLGIALKVITGDNALIAEHLAREVGIFQRSNSYRTRDSRDERAGIDAPRE